MLMFELKRASGNFDIFQMFKRRGERLRSIFPATGAKLPHPTGPQLPRLAVLSSRIYFRLFDKHFQMFNFGSPTPGIFNSLTKVWGRGGWKFQLETDWVWETGHGRFRIGYIALLMPLFSQRTLWTWLRPGFHLSSDIFSSVLTCVQRMCCISPPVSGSPRLLRDIHRSWGVAKSGRSGRYIYLCYLFWAGANLWTMHARTSDISTS